jgi:hypothetical protein
VKNLVTLIIAVSFLSLTSCTKESIHSLDAKPHNEYLIEANDASIYTDTPSETTEQNAAPTIQLQVVSLTIAGNNCTVDFSGNEDYTDTEIETQQHIKFKNSHGNTVELDFDVNSFSGENGTCTIEFNINGQSLSGLQVELSQNIIVQDDLII